MVWLAGLAAQVSVAHFWVVEQLLSGALHDDSAVFQDIRAVGNFQGLVGVLLHQKHRHALFAQLLDDVENLLNDDRCQA